MAKILTEKAKLQVVPQQTQGPNQNMILVDEKKIELAMVTMGVALQGLTGTAAWTRGKKYENVRALFPMYDTPLQCVALKKSGIESFKQLDGKTVGTGPKAGTAGTYFPLIFEALGLKVQARNGQSADMANLLNDGVVDAFCFGAGIPVPAFSDLDARPAGRLLHLDRPRARDASARACRNSPRRAFPRAPTSSRRTTRRPWACSISRSPTRT